MDTSSYGTGFGIILDLEELDKCLLDISDDQHKWTTHLGNGAFREGHEPCCVDIWYTNPGLADMPNGICYRFPVIREDSLWGPTFLVCLHASVATQIVMGLYFEGDELKYDPLEDFDGFWRPLKNYLCATISASTKEQ